MVRADPASGGNSSHSNSCADGCPNCASERTTAAQLDALDAELHDAHAYIKFSENLDRFLATLNDTADTVGHPRAPTRQARHRRSPAAPRRAAGNPLVGRDRWALAVFRELTVEAVAGGVRRDGLTRRVGVDGGQVIAATKGWWRSWGGGDP
jgi:hypothetical protein